MPLPLGHAAIGWVAYDLCSKKTASLRHWRLFSLVAVLANLPDMDVLLGLLLAGNGSLYHRGPTHSLVFALLAGFLASNAWRAWHQIPKIKFGLAFLIILSHVLADLLFTTSPTSLFWPLEVHWSTGYSGWDDVMTSVFLTPLKDAGIILLSFLTVFMSRLLRGFNSRIKPFIPEAIRALQNRPFHS
jgi:membrane-bound metal-dependent hydrolase YbcI (DUF457 family)